jgi:hypothetical protein
VVAGFGERDALRSEERFGGLPVVAILGEGCGYFENGFEVVALWLGEVDGVNA